MSFRYSRYGGIIGKDQSFIERKIVEDLEYTNIKRAGNYLRSKELTGTQGYTVGLSPTKDMNVTSGRTIPSGYNPSGSSLTPTGSRYYWNDLGGDIFDGWGDFYIYNPANGAASYIVFTTRNGGDGTIYTETQTHHSKTFTIKHGWVTTGIFKLDVACQDGAFEFSVGCYGNMGSDGSTANIDYSYSATWGLLRYNRNYQTNNTNESWYTYVIFRDPNFNDNTVQDSVGWFTSIYGSDNYACWTGTIKYGMIFYWSKGPTNLSSGWIQNDIEEVGGVWY